MINARGVNDQIKADLNQRVTKGPQKAFLAHLNINLFIGQGCRRDLGGAGEISLACQADWLEVSGQR